MERFRSDQDRRRTEVRITPAGRTLLKTAPKPPTELLIAGLATMDDGELHALAAGLLRLTAEMGLAAAPAPMLFEDETVRRPTPRKRVRNG